MRRFNVLEFVKELFCDFTYESKSYDVLNFSWPETMRLKTLIVFLCVTWAVAFTSACCREKQMDSFFTNVKRWCFDSILKVRIHTGLYRFTEIGHTFYVKYIFKNKNTFQVEIWPISHLNDSETKEWGLKRVKIQIIS